MMSVLGVWSRLGLPRRPSKAARQPHSPPSGDNRKVGYYTYTTPPLFSYSSLSIRESTLLPYIHPPQAQHTLQHTIYIAHYTTLGHTMPHYTTLQCTTTYYNILYVPHTLHTTLHHPTLHHTTPHCIITLPLIVLLIECSPSLSP
jgi:hypothetical protein